ncbi:MAG TPA: M20/M25/M40 family metallo-hydrolase, partial [Chitinophagaceae bacterium]|nr:M20/M25/M40 family metallo-hydrolase [Chitinophagaceae bacterium]
RKAGTPGSEKAAAFIASEFQKAGLQPLSGTGFLQTFYMLRPKPVQASGTVDGVAIPSQNLISLTFQPSLQVTQASGYTVEHIKKEDDLFKKVRALMGTNENKIVFVDTAFAAQFPRFARFQQPAIEGANKPAESTNLIFVLGEAMPKTFSFAITQDIERIPFSNVVGVLPGKSKKEEQVVFSAHYDHLGIGRPQAGDSIYNGANDDAAGTTAVILLANHFKKRGNNERTLVFAAFTAEEIGGFGSQYFSQQLTPEKVTAMFNIEMIGTESKWGRNSAYITGFDKTDMGAILQKNLKGSPFVFHPDPYPEQQLFYRSDNATLARLGVAAHTISTSKMDSEANYHQASDEVKTLDLANMTEIIKAIAQSAISIISGIDTPTRVKRESLR